MSELSNCCVVIWRAQMLQQQQQQLQIPGLQHSVENAPPVGVRDFPFWQVSEVFVWSPPWFGESMDVEFLKECMDVWEDLYF